MQKGILAKMEIFHNSQSEDYRCPCGAMPTDGELALKVKVVSDEKPKRVTLRLWMNGREELVDMKSGALKRAERIYCTKIKLPEKPCLLWYYFIIECGGIFYYANAADGLGGIGAVYNSPPDKSYQITVYDKEYKTPDWFKDCVMYQIFTDRFFGYHEDGKIPKKRDEYIIHLDWYDPISFNSHPHEMGPACNDFYGGNLMGIIKKLPYLSELGIGVIYLNPIFNAYSNHKYDTANYKEIDPMFGNSEIFEELCRCADEYGIKIILDGVFSHTGSDSVYFNKYGTYGEGVGAFQNPNSKYRSWYKFTDYPNYESWWGCSNLPNVNEMEPSYLDYILRGDDAVVKKWLRSGASGWRLDVADELPDEFIKIMRSEVKAENPDAVIIGEVWEDASNKVSYSEQREYLLGHELDSVMNYPFKDSVTQFMLGAIDAEQMNRRFMSIIENYPPQTLYSLMNIAGTHDTIRLKTMMGEQSAECGAARLSSYMEEIATKRVMLVAFMQMTFVGVPCIYYGDEVGMQGGTDPFNRATFPWRGVDPQLLDFYRSASYIRNNSDCLRRGRFKTLVADGAVYVYARYISNMTDALGGAAQDGTALCFVNRGKTPCRIELSVKEFGAKKYYRILDGFDEVLTKDGILSIDIPPIGCELLTDWNLADF